jgi:hypothetical protein
MVRLYFNRREDSPLVWSIDDGDQANEVNVEGVMFDRVMGVTHYNSANKYPKPSGWLEFPEAKYVLVGNVAYISRQ